MKSATKSPKVYIIDRPVANLLSRNDCRKIVTKILSHYVDEVDMISLAHDEYGKPFIRENENIAFSYSHSNEMLVVAVDPRSKAIGIDTEHISRAVQLEELNGLAFSKEERGLMDESDVLLLWCAKEAAVKRIGKGFREADPSEFTIRIDNDSYKLYLSGNEIDAGYILNRYVADNLIVVCSNKSFSDAEFTQISTAEIAEEQYV